ncbi:Cutinase transcription factor 1 beta [Fusarium albosuccineum]|uniref:Cutinase transcription factor 1 beta n=1 Tax=Fusarium albosuccineum TaxID=1237068 RepID=A0A8H4LFT7_9HYPO|nr:Cutinase transcription factor 1 beta [Fusarium albosuccineum]
MAPAAHGAVAEQSIEKGQSDTLATNDAAPRPTTFVSPLVQSSQRSRQLRPRVESPEISQPPDTSLVDQPRQLPHVLDDQPLDSIYVRAVGHTPSYEYEAPGLDQESLGVTYVEGGRSESQCQSEPHVPGPDDPSMFQPSPDSQLELLPTNLLGAGQPVEQPDDTPQFIDLEASNPWQYQGLPSFVKLPTARLAIDDLAYLRSKGALTVPDGRLQDSLIQAYLEHVHPLLPLINIEDFVESVTEANETNSQVSLLFFQAVMFSGSAYVDMDTLKDAGFKTRKQARGTLYRRVRLLYDFDCETDGLVIVQALLLMTFAFAQTLHVDPRLISFGMRRPPRIRDDDFRVPMLELADFQSEHLSGKKRPRTESVCSYFNDKARRTTLARLCIAQASLCKCLKYSPCNLDTRGITSLDGALPADGRSFAACHRDLLDWYDTLCHSDLYQPIRADDIHDDGSANLELNRAVLHMIYYAGVLGLHRSRVYSSLLSPDEKELSKTFLQHSAKRISEMAGNIEERGLDRFLPMTAISTTISAVSVHLLEIRGVFQADIFNAQENYQRCMRVVESIKELYSATKVAADSSELELSQEDDLSYASGLNGRGDTGGWIETLQVPVEADVSLDSQWMGNVRSVVLSP